MIQDLSTTAAAKLAQLGRTDTAETIDSLTKLLIKHGMTPFTPVIHTFLHFGGYTLPFPLEGRFQIYRLKSAIRCMTSNDRKSSDPVLFRLPFGASETVQSYYWINGLGQLFEDETKMANSMVEWIENWARN